MPALATDPLKQLSYGIVEVWKDLSPEDDSQPDFMAEIGNKERISMFLSITVLTQENKGICRATSFTHNTGYWLKNAGRL